MEKVGAGAVVGVGAWKIWGRLELGLGIIGVGIRVVKLWGWGWH